MPSHIFCSYCRILDASLGPSPASLVWSDRMESEMNRCDKELYSLYATCWQDWVRFKENELFKVIVTTNKIIRVRVVGLPPPSVQPLVSHSLSFGACDDNISCVANHSRESKGITYFSEQTHLLVDKVGNVKKRHNSSAIEINSRRTSSACPTKLRSDDSFPFQPQVVCDKKNWIDNARKVAI